MKAYAGIGSRQTPPDVLARMRVLGEELARHGWILRSGSAPGADTAFEVGCDLGRGCKEIFLPWLQWQGRAQGDHPAWDYLSPTAKACHARNTFQVMGLDLASPVRMVICWTAGAAAGAALFKASMAALKSGR